MSFDACAALVQRADPDRFRAAMAAPLTVRRVLIPIYAFLTEVARAPWVTQEPLIAEMRLQWWRDALEEIASGGGVRRHEVTTPLADVLTPDSARLLDRVVEARRWDIHREPFAGADQLREYLVDTCAAPMSAAARSLGADGDFEGFGFGVGLSRYALAAPMLKAQRKVPWPEALDQGRFAADGLEALRTAPGGPICYEGAFAAPVLAALASGKEPTEVGPLRKALRLAAFSSGLKRSYAR
ncbi:MAG: squalene/phytoene synthase family protein [Shimia sp.]